MILLHNLLLMPSGGGGGSSGGSSSFLILLVLMFVVFYFFMIRPQMRKQKQETQFRNDLKKGDKVVTIGGIHGRILEVADKYFMLEIDSNVKVKIDKTAVAAEATKALNNPAAESK
jgi:preprotein translocase subunit YajC